MKFIRLRPAPPKAPPPPLDRFTCRCATPLLDADVDVESDISDFCWRCGKVVDQQPSKHWWAGLL